MELVGRHLRAALLRVGDGVPQCAGHVAVVSDGCGLHVALIDLGNEVAVRQIDRVRASVGHEQVDIELVAQNQQQKQHEEAGNPPQSTTTTRSLRAVWAVWLAVRPHRSTRRRPIIRVAQGIGRRRSTRLLARIFPALLCPERVSIPHRSWHLLSRTDRASAPRERNVARLLAARRGRLRTDTTHYSAVVFLPAYARTYGLRCCLGLRPPVLSGPLGLWARSGLMESGLALQGIRAKQHIGCSGLFLPII